MWVNVESWQNARKPKDLDKKSTSVILFTTNSTHELTRVWTQASSEKPVPNHLIMA